MKKINILHVASFHGNIGDNANHNGLRNKLKEILDNQITFNEIEMREFYQSWNTRSFNTSEFIQLCNSHDLVIIGGGNFFELKWDYSYTGTTINISENTLSKIKTPMLFFGLGCDIGKGSNESTIKKFGDFLQTVTSSNQFMVTFRNDGSISTLEGLYGKRYSRKVHKVADGAFFMDIGQKKLPFLVSKNRRGIGINLACDMEDVRFNKNLTYGEFVNEYAKFLNDFLQENRDYDILFFPHIYSDLKITSDIMNKLNDQFRRYRLTVAPYLSGQGAEQIIFGMYQECDVILGMRFHSNVCAIALNIPTIGLSSYKKIDDLYEELNLFDRVIHVNKEGFNDRLSHMLNETLKNRQQIKKEYEQVLNRIDIENNCFYNELKKWIHSKVIID